MHILQKISYGWTFLLATALCVLAEASSAKAASFQGLGDLPEDIFLSRFGGRDTLENINALTVEGIFFSRGGRFFC